MTEIVTTYLEMTSRDQLRPKDASDSRFRVVEASVDQWQFNRFLYSFVGKQWSWTDKEPWTDEQWSSYVEDDALRTFVAYYGGSPVGYFELQQQDGGDVEIIYFGVGPGFIGKGFGGYLLTCAIESAWDWDGTKRVWVHTCSLDHPAALENYKSRGMTVYKTETS